MPEPRKERAAGAETLLLRRLLLAAQLEAANELDCAAHDAVAERRAFAILRAWLAPKAGATQ
jgi:hypothetical protein